MKRKINILIAVLILTASLLCCLVACVPSRPDKFLQKIMNVDSVLNDLLMIDDKNLSKFLQK